MRVLGNEEERVNAWEKATYSSTGNEGSGNLTALMRRSISVTPRFTTSDPLRSRSTGFEVGQRIIQFQSLSDGARAYTM